MDGYVWYRTRVDCKDCPFSEELEADDERLPGEVVIEHGRETGHILRVENLDR